MAHDLEAGKKLALKTILILGAITVTEVLVALTGKGYIISGFHMAEAILAIIMIAMSAYKAYLIVFEFMHMRHEVKGLRFSVLLPMLLLVWAIIAFFSEGNHWLHNRDQIIEKNEQVPAVETIKPVGD
ncbi:MAG: cytochrome C oxidase subunit IV family protein [Saprospiraceae bacterium]|nr:cytochrome C oxidase subunit IV family protein [Saprospiraceae bacterium]MCB9318539.1 cytochrome C oxidase subunit IV family protein [Lewinellaceae bacterium]